MPTASITTAESGVSTARDAGSTVLCANKNAPSGAAMTNQLRRSSTAKASKPPKLVGLGATTLVSRSGAGSDTSLSIRWEMCSTWLFIRPTFKTETALARLLNRLWERTREQIQKIWADGAYAGRLIDWVQDNLEAVLEIVEREEDQDGFEVLPRRWVVERTFAWLGRYRRLRKDYERCLRNSEGMIYLASIHTMAKRLAPDS